MTGKTTINQSNLFKKDLRQWHLDFDFSAINDCYCLFNKLLYRSYSFHLRPLFFWIIRGFSSHSKICTTPTVFCSNVVVILVAFNIIKSQNKCCSQEALRCIKLMLSVQLRYVYSFLEQMCLVLIECKWQIIRRKEYSPTVHLGERTCVEHIIRRFMFHKKATI